MGVKIETTVSENGLRIIKEIKYNDNQGYVYFILSPKMKMIKIGWAKRSVEQRLIDLQVGSADKLEIINYFSGTLKDERNMHKLFGDFHSHGEWFYECDEIYNYLNRYYSDYIK